LNAVSGVIDWKFAPKWDVYTGLMWTEFNGGLSNGFFVNNNIACTAGLRFRSTENARTWRRPAD
jgi:hypothetical protein